MSATPKQRARRLTPRFYPSEDRWVVDLPADMNAGHRARKLFKRQDSAFRFISQFMAASRIGTLTERVAKADASNKISGLVPLYLASMEMDGQSPDGIKQAKTCLRRFVLAFGDLSPDAITGDDIDDWIERLDFATRTIFNHFAQARQFYAWKEIRKLVTKSPFEEATTPPKTDEDARKQILTPDQMRELLDLPISDPWIKCKIVLGGFAGLRTCEMARMSYDCVDEEFEEINVNKNQSKKGKAMRPRSITLQDAVLRHLPKGEGPLISSSKEWRHHRGMPAEARLGYKRFPQNALRHSFASYHLAHFRDASKTAFEMGHTNSKLLYETYANAVSRRDAAAWWAL
jgi:integrase